MSSYIGMVQIDSNNTSLVGSTLYGVCNSNAEATAKTVVAQDLRSVTQDATDTKFINNNFDTPLQGVTIHVKFVNGNTATSGLTLQVGSVITAYNIVGNCTCPANTIISFTFDENQNWIVNDNVDTNTEYVFAGNTPYNASTNKALAESSVSAAAHKGVVTDIANNSSSTDLPTTAAVASYVQSMTGGLAGLSGAMHFRGIVTDPTVTITDGGTQLPKIEGYDLDNGNPRSNFTQTAGDVILFGQQEYVWSGSAWELLGDESSYALKSNTDTITEVSNWEDGDLPTLTVTPVSIPNVTSAGTAPSLTVTPVDIPNVTQAGTATQMSVSAGILNITLGQNTVLGTDISVGSASDWNAGSTPTLGTSISVGSASGWDAGALPTLSTHDTTVVVPIAPTP